MTVGAAAGARARARVPLPLAALTVLVAALLGVVGALLVLAAARDAPQALPALHGARSWAPGARPAPRRTPHGRTAVVAFLGGGCAGCLAELRSTVSRLPRALRPAVVLAPASAAAAYGVATRRPLLVLVDKRGDERTGYTFPFLPPFLEDDLRTLAAEGA